MLKLIIKTFITAHLQPPATKNAVAPPMLKGYALKADRLEDLNSNPIAPVGLIVRSFL